MKTIMCNFNLFDAAQNVLIHDDGTLVGACSLDTTTFGKSLAELCEAQDIYDVFLSAPKSYALEKIIPEVDKYTSNKFSEKKINIRVKGE